MLDQEVIIFIILLFVIITPAFILLIYFGSQKQQQRAKEPNRLFENWAKKHRFEYIPDMTYLGKKMFQGSPWMGREGGIGRFGFETILKGYRIRLFYWTVYERVGEMKIEKDYVAAVADIHTQKGWFLLRKENFNDKLDGALGKGDLDFENREFSQKYYVSAKPQRLAYDFFHPRMIEVFMSENPYDVLLRGGKMCLIMNVSDGLPYSPEDFEYFQRDLLKQYDRAIKMLIKILPKVPSFLRGAIDVEPMPVGEKQVEKETVAVICPSCKERFNASTKEPGITCPRCGLEGEV